MSIAYLSDARQEAQMVSAKKRSNNKMSTLGSYLQLVLTIFFESFKKLNKTTNIFVVTEKGKKQILRVEYK